MACPDGSIKEGEFGLSYPVYTAAGAVLILSSPGNAQYRSARDAWLGYLSKRQLTETLGWQRGDREYGGWGYSLGLPRKPAQQALTESNLSATAFALQALRAANCPPDDPAYRKALGFVERCQNFERNPKRREPAFDDGGFFFIYDDPARNKAGLAGTDRRGRIRYFSYGSATADGLRSLIACGLPSDHPRVVAAHRWLETNWSAAQHPGRFATDRENVRPAVYFYYAYSVAEALRAGAGPKLRTGSAEVEWAGALADQLIRRQRKDGSWCNQATFVREDDPVTATALAMSALTVCREVMVAQPAAAERQR
jgi:squalene-hopene/tetraprenyl-beta-curcumene cyclase